ncbi:MAG: DUF2461 domain-containing protein [Ignavibacteriae bacterium]|nr:MAG: DUF2461 domain-containing protein [Ignavibacteriota bacterium]
MTKIPLMDIDLYPPFEGFPKECIRFFKQLKRNNNREWFDRHKEDYERAAKIPMLSFIASLQPHFARFAPEFDLHPKRSLFRIYRDIRFSSDKTPYKTHIAAHFVLRGRPKGLVGSGYYIHIEPGEFFVGGGIYIPDGDQLKKIRKAIATRGEEFLSIVQDRRFQKRFAPFEWSTLQRIPKGYDESHPMAEWLKFKQFFVGVTLPESKIYSESLVGETARICEEASPLVRFLNKSLV